MKGNGWLWKGAIAALLLLFVIFLGYQINKNLSVKITTMDATSVTVEELISKDAVFLRSQTAVKGLASDYADYLTDNGEKVFVGGELCIFFADEAAYLDYQKLKDIRNSIEALEYTDSLVSSGMDGAKVDSLIYSRIENTLAALREGSLAKADKDYSTLRQLVITRDAGLYSKQDSSEKISSLKKQADRYETLLANKSNIIYSPFSGYFLTESDGFEAVFSDEIIDSLTPEYLAENSRIAASSSPDTVGALVDGFYWYLAVVLDANQTTEISKKMENGASLPIYVPNIGSSADAFTVHKIIRAKDGSSVAVFKCPIMSEAYLGTRFQPVDIVVASYTGIKVPRAALHQKDGVWGVYCMESSEMLFKPVKWIYHTDSYYILEMAESSAKGIYLYDKVVLGGNIADY